MFRAGIFITLWLAGASAAFGHAAVLSTEPPDGAVLDAAPVAVVIRFNEPVSLIAAQVIDGSGRALAQPEPASAKDMAVRIALPAGLGEGAYVASYRVVSLDSHPVGGSIVFTVGAAEASGARPTLPPEEAVVDTAWRVAFVALLTVFYAGIFGSAGCILFVLAVRLPEEDLATCGRISVGFALLAIVSAVLVTGVEGGYLLDASPWALLSTSPWRTGFGSTLGRSAAVVLVGEVLIAAGGLRFRSVFGRAVAALGAILALASFALTGHVATASPRDVTAPLLLLHTTPAAFWIGSLLPLHRLVRRAGPDAAQTVRRFSRIAIGSVAVLVVAGVLIAAFQVGSFAALFRSRYGAILLLKLALVAMLLLLATLNKLRLTPRLEAGVASARSELERSIAAEIGLAVLILIATAVLNTTPPPRIVSGGEVPATMTGAHHHAPPGPLLMVHASNAMALLTFESATAGENTVAIELSDAAGAPLVAKEVSLVAENKPAGVEPIRRAAASEGNGRWRVDGLTLVPAGRWTVRIDALVSDFEKTTFEAAVDLR